MEKTHQPVCCCGNACRVRQFAKYNARLNGELGKTSQQLISAFGQPSKVRKLANGDEIISYVSINYQVIPDPNYYFNTGFMTENELFDPFTYGDDEIPVGDFMGETITDFAKPISI